MRILFASSRDSQRGDTRANAKFLEVILAKIRIRGRAYFLNE